MTNASRKPRIAVLLGDVAGVGPEMGVKLLADPSVRATAEVLLIGRAHV